MKLGVFIIGLIFSTALLANDDRTFDCAADQPKDDAQMIINLSADSSIRMSGASYVKDGKEDLLWIKDHYFLKSNPPQEVYTFESQFVRTRETKNTLIFNLTKLTAQLLLYKTTEPLEFRCSEQ